MTDHHYGVAKIWIIVLEIKNNTFIHVYYYDYLWLIWTHWILKAEENLDSHSYINSLMKKLKYFTWVLGEIRANHSSLFNTVTCSSLPQHPWSPWRLSTFLFWLTSFQYLINSTYLLLFVPSSHYNGFTKRTGSCIYFVCEHIQNIWCSINTQYYAE